jgi:molybdopterin-guanine dinucleotide biosynthesis protein A
VTVPAVVIAAGLGTRLRPLTERYAKPVLPIDGVPVLSLLLRELADAGCPQVTIVTGHLGAQVERLAGDGSGFGLDLRYASQGSPDGSAHAVVAAEATPPYLVIGADKRFARGDIGRFATAFGASGAAGALAVEPRPGTVRVRDGLVEKIVDTGVLGAPLWAIGPGVAPFVQALPGKLPFELATAFQAAIDAGERVAGIEIGPTRDLTTPIDVLEQNFPYLRQL